MYGYTKQHSSSAHEEMQGMWWPKETAHFITRTDSTARQKHAGPAAGKQTDDVRERTKLKKNKLHRARTYLSH